MKIIELKSKDKLVSEIYQIKNKKEGQTKAGKPFIAFTVCDNTGTASAKIWNVTEDMIFENNDFCMISGTVSMYRNKPLINVETISKIEMEESAAEEEPEANTEEIQEDETSPEQLANDTMWEHCVELINSVENPYLNFLLCDILCNDEEMNEHFRYGIATKSVRQTFCGGLMAHTLKVADICENLCRIFPEINRDLVVTAALLHDIGKTRMYTQFPENNVTDSGYLLGHIYLSAEIVSKRAAMIEDFPEDTLNELVHCILSHHGNPENGSPQFPQLIEAVVLNAANEFDARIELFIELTKDTEDREWVFTKYVGYGKNVRKTLTPKYEPVQEQETAEEEGEEG